MCPRSQGVTTTHGMKRILTQHGSAATSHKLTGSDLYVLGDTPLSEAVATRLRNDGQRVALVGVDLDSESVPTYNADPTDVRNLEAVGIGTNSTVVVTTRDDSRNFLIAQLMRSKFDVDRTLVLTNRPDRLDAFDHAEHEPVCVTSALADTVIDRL